MRCFCGTSDTSNTENSSDASKTSATVTRLSSYLIFNKKNFQQLCECQCLGSALEEAKLACETEPYAGSSFWDKRSVPLMMMMPLWWRLQTKVDMLTMILRDRVLCRVVLLGQEVGPFDDDVNMVKITRMDMLMMILRDEALSSFWDKRLVPERWTHFEWSCGNVWKDQFFQNGATLILIVHNVWTLIYVDKGNRKKYELRRRPCRLVILGREVISWCFQWTHWQSQSQTQ